VYALQCLTGKKGKRVTGKISSLLDVETCQPEQLHGRLHGATFVPVLFADNARY